jgi:hypothetical protein
MFRYEYYEEETLREQTKTFSERHVSALALEVQTRLTAGVRKLTQTDAAYWETAELL